MYLFSHVQKARRGVVQIPRFMRAVLHLHVGTKLTITSKMGQGSSLQNQLVIASIPPHHRVDLWNLTISFRDRPGIVAELTRLFAERNIRIIEFTTLTRNQNNEAVVNINFDAQHYESIFDGSVQDREKNPGKWLKELYAVIVSEFIGDIIFRPDGKPLMYLKRNEVLKDSIENINISYSKQIVLRESGEVRIPKEIIWDINKRFGEVYPSVTRRSPPLVALAVDPENRSILSTVFFPNTGYVHVRIHTQSGSQALHSITQVLFEHGLNVEFITARNIFTKSPFCKIDVLLHLPPERDEKKNDGSLKQWINGIFQGSALRNLKCRVDFPDVICEGEECLEHH